MVERGKLYVIEGGDGAGKGTQAEITREHRARTTGRNVFKTSFPRYGKPSARLVELILNGHFGSDPYNLSISPELCARAFAEDRLAGTPEIIMHLERGDDTILDRYDTSNKAYQAAKYRDMTRRRALYDWIENMEKNELGILQPDHTVVLLVPPAIAHNNVAKKEKRSYTDMTHDIHEGDLSYQENVQLAYIELCELNPEKYTPIECTTIDGEMRTFEDIQLDIRKALGI